MDLRLWLKAGFNKWRLILLVFVVFYAGFLLLELEYMSIQWDEIPHLYGGLLMSRGEIPDYLTTYGYYPPFYDFMTTGFFQVLGVSAASGRLTAVMFSLFSIWITFEFAKRMYGPKTALVSSVMLGVMPGFFWLSRITMLETMLIFFFSLTVFIFFTWLIKNTKKTLILTGLALGVGILAKYQVLVSAFIMIVAILWMCRGKLKHRFTKLLFILLVGGAVAVPWFVMVFQANGLDTFQDLIYVMQEGGQDRIDYSTRFPAPIFYLIEMTWPFNDIPVHPISLPLYVLGLLGLCLFAWRRKPEDKIFLTWFAVVYVFFTFIPNKQWRYITPVFPVLAISAASFAMFLYGKISVWKPQQTSLNGQKTKKFVATLFIILTAAAIVYSSYDAYQMTARDQIHIPLEETANYLAGHLDLDESAVVVCAFNLLNQDMLRFYLPPNMSSDQIWQYPDLSVDAFTPNFSITELISRCEQRNVKYAVLYDYGADTPFFNTTLTYTNVTTLLFTSGRFGYTGDEPFFGDMPYRTFLVGFHEPFT
ncbi:MAG: glycosyltransferase family 39 protein [Candidatus Bathyarchaeota archaeon]|nr:glycosyltransferase family 39 protein [Candidatus Bathyarchaeota archaeon]